MSDTEPICGESYDHDQLYTYDDDTDYAWVCRRCGAEGWGAWDDDDSVGGEAS